MANPKGAYSGNGKYKKEMATKVVELYANGESDAEVAVLLNVSRSMYYRWIKEHPEFAEGVEIGKTLAEAWWQKLGRAGASGKVKINSRVYLANMKNRFAWQENPNVDEEGIIDQNIVAIAAALKAIKEKHQREY